MSSAPGPLTDAHPAPEPSAASSSAPSNAPSNAPSVATWWRLAFAALAGALIVVVIGYGSNGHPSGDFWEHAAVVRALSVHPLKPQHPLFAVDAPHAFLSPYALFWGLVSRHSGATAQSTLVLASGVNVVLFCASLVWLVRRASKHPWPTAMLALSLWLFAWGDGAWSWSGFFHFEAMVLTASYPSTFAASLVLIAVSLAWNLDGSRIRLAVLAALTALCWVTHPTSAVVLTAAVCAVTIARARLAWRAALDVAVVVATLIAGFAVATLWPYYSLLSLLTSSDNAEFDRASMVLYTHVPLRIWPTFVLAPVALLRLRDNRRDPFVALMLGVVPLYLLGLFGHAGLGRAISWIVVFTHLAVAETVADVVARRSLRGQRAAVAVAVALAVAVVAALHGHMIDAAWPAPPDDFGQSILRGTVRDGDVVLADVDTGYVVPSVGGRVIAWKHPVYWVDDHDERRADVKRFFASTTPERARRDILTRWHARFIFVDVRKKTDRVVLSALATKVKGDKRFELWRVKRAKAVPKKAGALKPLTKAGPAKATSAPASLP